MSAASLALLTVLKTPINQSHQIPCKSIAVVNSSVRLTLTDVLMEVDVVFMSVFERSNPIS